MKSKKVTAMVNRIIKKHGPVIDLRKNPNVLIDVMRELASDIAAGNPCGGTPPSPTGPSRSDKASRPVSNEDIMRATLRSARDIASIRSSVEALAKKRR